jgi:hypothetical protein
MFLFFKTLQKLQLTRLIDDSNLFQAVRFFNRPKFHGRHLESRSTSMTKKMFVLMSCLKVISNFKPTFYRGKVKA